jgi:hypothetical protein
MNQKHREIEKMPANSPRAKIGFETYGGRRVASNGGGELLYTAVMLN